MTEILDVSDVGAALLLEKKTPEELAHMVIAMQRELDAMSSLVEDLTEERNSLVHETENNRNILSAIRAVAG